VRSSRPGGYFFFQPPRLRGTLAPFFRASDKPMAIACLRLFTVLPLPDLSVPFLRRRIALSTRFDAALPYFRLPEDFRAAISEPPTPLVDIPVNLSVRLAHVVPKKDGVNRAAFRLFPSS
jgi:hypothetical protein